ncbi:MAG: YihY/virulence factor BrkB family protein [Rhizobiaceae bacterium]
MNIGWRHLVSETLVSFNKDDGWAMASHVALSIIMALFPFLIFATALAGFLGNEDHADHIIAVVFDTWPDQIAQPIASEIRTVLGQNNVGFLTAGIGFALLFASNGVEAVRLALNRAYGTNENRSFLYCRLQSLVFVFLGAVVLLVSSFGVILTPFLASFAEEMVPALVRMHDTGLWLLRYSFSATALTFAVFACHVWLPADKRSVSEVWPGIAATLSVWVRAAMIFSNYIERFADYGSTFAGLAGIMTVQIFLYLMAVILILGGELNAALSKHI